MSKNLSSRESGNPAPSFVHLSAHANAWASPLVVADEVGPGSDQLVTTLRPQTLYQFRSSFSSTKVPRKQEGSCGDAWAAKGRRPQHDTRRRYSPRTVDARRREFTLAAADPRLRGGDVAAQWTPAFAGVTWRRYWAPTRGAPTNLQQCRPVVPQRIAPAHRSFRERTAYSKLARRRARHEASCLVRFRAPRRRAASARDEDSG